MHTTNTVSGNINIPMVSWDQYFNGLTRMKVQQTIEPYDELPTEGEEPDTHYDGSYQVVQDLADPSAVIRVQFLEQLDRHSDVLECPAADLQDTISGVFEGVFQEDKYVLIKLSDTEYVLAPHSKDDAVVKLCSMTQGAIIVLRAKMFIRLKTLKEETNARI